jgi:hypothetical protein
MNYISLLFPVLLAFAYRARGGAIPLGSTTFAHIVFWALPVGCVLSAVSYSQNLPTWIAAFASIGAFSGIQWIGHANEQTDNMTAYEGMTYIVTSMLALIMAPFIVYLSYIHTIFDHRVYIASVLLGVLTMPLCWLSYRIKFGLGTFITIRGKKYGIQWCVPGDSSWEEFFIGALFGFIFAIVGVM